MTSGPSPLESSLRHDHQDLVWRYEADRFLRDAVRKAW